MIGSGIRRPSEPAHHSSNIQSLYALTQRSASSLSLRFEERLAAEARERRERERRLDPVDVHVLEARLRVAAARAHVVHRDRADRDLVAAGTPAAAIRRVMRVRRSS